MDINKLPRRRLMKKEQTTNTDVTQTVSHSREEETTGIKEDTLEQRKQTEQASTTTEATHNQLILDRLALLDKSPYQDYSSAFISTLCRKEQVAALVIDGKVAMKDTTLQTVIGYSTSILSDIGGKLAPLGTLTKVIDDLAGWAIGKVRKEKKKRVTELAGNHLEMLLLAQTLMNSIVIAFEPSWCSNLKPKQASRLAESLGKTLAKSIERKKLTFNADTTLADRAQECFQYIIKKELIDCQADQISWCVGRFDKLLPLAIAQVLHLETTYFIDLDTLMAKMKEWEAKIESLVTNKEDWAQQSDEKRREAIVAIVAPGSDVSGGTIQNNTIQSFALNVPCDMNEEQVKRLKDFFSGINPKVIKAVLPDKVIACVIAPGVTAKKAVISNNTVQKSDIYVRSANEEASSQSSHAPVTIDGQSYTGLNAPKQAVEKPSATQEVSELKFEDSSSTNAQQEDPTPKK